MFQVNGKMLVMTLVASALTACSALSPVQPTSMPKGPQTVVVSMTNHQFKFSPEKFTSGDVKFIIKNDTTDTMHEFQLVKTDLTFDKLPKSPDDPTKIDEASTALVKLGSVDDVAAGKSGEMSLKLDPGKYMFFCNQPGHFNLGMRGEITVAP